MKNKYKIVGDAFKHCQYSNNPMPPTSISNYIEWDWNVGTNEDLVFYVDDAIKNPLPGHKKKIAWLIEPYIKKPHLCEWLKTNYHLFDYVLMNDIESSESIPNSIFYPFGGCWIEEENRRPHEKTKLVSIITSNKKQVPEHHKRHQIIAKYGRAMDVFGRGYTPIEPISKGLNDYMFHIALENQKRDLHFSEKLINPLMTYTVPIYSGMPSIGKYFDTRGMILFDEVDEIKDIMLDINKKKYNDMFPYLKENAQIAKEYILGEDWLWKQGFFDKL